MRNITNFLREYSAEAESKGHLTAEQLKIIHEQRWFHLFVPARYGGLDLSVPEAVSLEERIAFIDGSVGWVVTLCAGAAMFVGYFDEQLAEEVFATEDTCIAGSGKTNGIAIPDVHGFTVTGSWPYASGAAHAHWFTANCLVEGVVRSFIFKREEVVLRAEWHTLGLNATAGYSFEVKNVHIPANRVFDINIHKARLPSPVYSYPFLQMAETTLTANILGMSLHFMELAESIITNRKRGGQLYQVAKKKITTAREEFYAALHESWNTHIQHDHIEERQLQRVSEASRSLARTARNMVNEVFPYCGLMAASNSSKVGLVWRNINTAGQHSLLLDPADQAASC